METIAFDEILSTTGAPSHSKSALQETQPGKGSAEALADDEAKLLAACGVDTGTVSRDWVDAMQSLWLPKGDFRVIVRLFPDGWAVPYTTHRWFGPEKVDLSYFSAREQKTVHVRLRSRWVVCLGTYEDVDGEPFACPMCAEVQRWDDCDEKDFRWEQAERLKAKRQMGFPVLVKAASWLKGHPVDPVVLKLWPGDYDELKSLLRQHGRKQVTDWEAGAWLILERVDGIFQVRADFAPLAEHLRQTCPPEPVLVTNDDRELCHALAETMAHWQASPKILNRDVAQLRTWMPGAAFIPQVLGTKKALVRKFMQDGAAWNYLSPEQQRLFDGALSSCNIAPLVGRNSRRLLEDKRTVCLCSQDLDADEHVPAFLAANPWAVDAQKSYGGRGCNVWFWLVLDRNKPFPDGVLLIWKKGSRKQADKVGELRLGCATTTLSGVHPSGKEYRIESPGTIPVIHYEDIQWPDEWEIEESQALREAQEAIELSKQLGRDAEGIREENRQRRRLSEGDDAPDWDGCSLDLEKLRHKRVKGDFIEAQCPACAEAGQDEKGEHLYVRKTGAYGCIIHSREREHNRRILELVGRPLSERMEAERMRLRRGDEEIEAMIAAGGAQAKEGANPAPGPKSEPKPTGKDDGDEEAKDGRDLNLEPKPAKGRDTHRNPVGGNPGGESRRERTEGIDADCPLSWFRVRFPKVAKARGDAVTQAINKYGITRITGVNEDFLAEAIGKSVSEKPVVFSSEENTFRQYNEGVYGAITAAQAGNQVSDLLRECDRAMASFEKLDVTKLKSNKQRMLDAIMKRAEGRLAVPRDFFLDGTGDFLACANGILRLTDFHLLPFSPELPFRGKLAVPYDPAATCPQFRNRLLKQALSAQSIDLLQRWSGLPLVGTNWAQKVVILEGTPGGGKGTLARVFQGVLGMENVGMLRPKQLEERFELSRLRAKKLIYGPDVPSDFLNLKSARVVKAMTGGDFADYEYKGSNESGGELMWLNLLITCNTRLRILLDGDTEAWRRRLVIIKFDRKAVAQSRFDASLSDRLLSEEGAGILNWMLEGLRALRAHGWELRLSRGQEKLRDDLLTASESHVLFAKEGLVKDDGGRGVTSEEVYDAYVRFCTQRGWAPLAKTLLDRRIGVVIAEVFGKNRVNCIRRRGRDFTGWTGLAVASDLTPDLKGFGDE